MTPVPKIVATTIDHAAVLAVLHAQSFEDAWDASGLVKMMQTPGVYGVVCYPDGNSEAAVAFGLGRVAVDEAEILTIAVATSSRHNGYGEKILDALMGDALARGAVQIFLEVAVDNPAAIRLYRRFGFETAGRRIGYYARPGGSVDGWIMQRTLTRSAQNN